MSDRALSLIFAVAIFVVAGCERPGIVSQPAVETAAAADSKTAEDAPLLLEDEPDNGAQSESGADNSRCFVCHVNYMQEKIAVTHARAGIGCAKCHGPSDAHIADESWASGGNGTAPDIMYPRDKIDSSCRVCHAREKIDTPEHQAVLADVPAAKVCTDCHGSHRLAQRRCKWK
jgi:hypothetical protein